MNAKLIAAMMVCAAVGSSVLVATGNMADDVAALQALSSEQQQLMLANLKSVCDGTSVDVNTEHFCAEGLCSILGSAFPSDVNPEAADFNTEFDCFGTDGKWTLMDVLDDFVLADSGMPTKMDDCMDGVTGHDHSIPDEGYDVGWDARRLEEIEAPRSLTSEEAEDSLPPTRLASLLANRKSTNDSEGATEEPRRLWGHRHNPHSHHTQCSGNGHSFDCDCRLETNWKRHGDAQVFNQCRKGGGNLAGESWGYKGIGRGWSFGSNTGGHINGHTWGIGVFSTDSSGPFQHNVCGKQPWWTFGCGGNSNNCKCTCFKAEAVIDGGRGQDPYGAGASSSAYNTKCMGMCGKDCKAPGGDRLRRYPSLVIHDACQAFVGSKDSIIPPQRGLVNQCADEALHGITAAAVGPCDSS